MSSKNLKNPQGRRQPLKKSCMVQILARQKLFFDKGGLTTFKNWVLLFNFWCCTFYEFAFQRFTYWESVLAQVAEFFLCLIKASLFLIRAKQCHKLGLHQLKMAILVQDNSLQHFSLLKMSFIDQNKTSFTRDECCHLTLCLHNCLPGHDEGRVRVRLKVKWDVRRLVRLPAENDRTVVRPVLSLFTGFTFSQTCDPIFDHRSIFCDTIEHCCCLG